MSDRKQAPGADDPKAASAATRPDSCATERKGAEQYTDAGPGVALVNRDFLLTKFSKDLGTQACPTASVTPLTADVTAL